MRGNRGKLLRRTGQERDDVKAYNLAEKKSLPQLLLVFFK